MRTFEQDVFPYIGQRPIAEIKPLELLEVLRRIEKRGALGKPVRYASAAERSSATQLLLAERSTTQHQISPAH